MTPIMSSLMTKLVISIMLFHQMESEMLEWTGAILKRMVSSLRGLKREKSLLTIVTGLSVTADHSVM